MAIEDGIKADTMLLRPMREKKCKWMNVMLLILRMTTILSTATAAFMMGSNKQSIRKAVAIVGTTTIYQTYTAKYQQTHAFVFFVIANAIAGFYNLVVLILWSFNNWKAFHVTIHLMDLVMLAVVATGAAAATSIAELGKNGNLNARWSPFCDHFGKFCIHGFLAIVASFIGAFLLVILNAVSVITLYNKASN